MNPNRQKIITTLEKIQRFLASLGDAKLTELEINLAYHLGCMNLPNDWIEGFKDFEFDCLFFFYSQAPDTIPDWIRCPISPEAFQEVVIPPPGFLIGEIVMLSHEGPLRGLSYSEAVEVAPKLLEDMGFVGCTIIDEESDET